MHVLFVRGFGGGGWGSASQHNPQYNEGGHSTEEEEKMYHSLKSPDSGSSLISAKHKFGVDMEGGVNDSES